MSARTSVLGYGIQIVLLHGYVADNLLLAWALAMVFFETLNGALAWWLARGCAYEAVRRRRQRWLAAALLGVGSCWGSVALMPGLQAMPQVHMFQVLCLVVVGIFSAQNLCLYWPALLTFNLGLMWPVALASGRHATDLSFPLQLTVIGLLLMVQIYGRTTRKVLLQGMRARVATEAMAAKLRQKNDDLTEALQVIEKMADLDPLTQCMNRRALMRQLQEPMRHERFGACFGIVLLDIDHFKQINDSRGHGAGDAVLVAVAERLRGQLRAQDALVRWGGEEFLCLMSDVDEAELRAMAERLREALASAPLLPAPRALSVTASLGLVLCRVGDNLDEAIDRADQAMYRAKRGGRNRVEDGCGRQPAGPAGRLSEAACG